jgi:hypothetical protein
MIETVFNRRARWLCDDEWATGPRNGRLRRLISPRSAYSPALDLRAGLRQRRHRPRQCTAGASRRSLVWSPAGWMA